MLKHRFPLSDSDRQVALEALPSANEEEKTGGIPIRIRGRDKDALRGSLFIGWLLARHALLPLLSPDFLALRSVIGRELDVVQVMK